MVKVIPSVPPSQTTFKSERELVDAVFATGTGGAELTPQPDSVGLRGDLSPHPCLTGNNSINTDDQDFKFAEELRKKEEKLWKEKINPLLSGYQRKQSQRMQHCIEFACKEYGRGSIGVLHLTFKDDPTYQVAQDRMNSLRTNDLSKRFNWNGLNNYITICERGEKHGKLHFHILVISPKHDFHTGSRFGFNKLTGKKTFHANADCRAQYDHYRNLFLSGKYKFGAHVRFEPLKTIKGGAKYFSKYVGKGHYTRTEDMKGKQLIRYGSGFQKYLGNTILPVYEGSSIKKDGNGDDLFKKWSIVQQINWVGGVSAGRRKVLAEIGASWGCENADELNYKLGPRWQHYAKDQMMVASCLAGYPIGERSQGVLSEYAKNKWGITILYGIGEMKNQVVSGYDDENEYTPDQLLDLSLNHLMDRLEDVEDFQYSDHLTLPMLGSIETPVGVRSLPSPVDEDQQESFPF